MLHPIYVTIVGSRLYGIAKEDSDYDIKGIAFGEMNQYCGMKKLPQDDYINGKEGKESYNGTIYEIRRCFELLGVGNPTMIEPFFASKEFIIHTTEVGEEVANFVRKNMVSKHFFQPYFGYHYSQIKEFENSRREGKRKELYETYGFDGKFAGHAYRLARQCVEIMTTGSLNPTLCNEDKDIIMKMRNYEYTKEECSAKLQSNIVDMEAALASSTLPETYDKAKVDAFVTNLVQKWVVYSYNGRSNEMVPTLFDIKSFPR